MRNCDYYQELVSRSLDDELSVEERKALAVHLASCPSCSQMRQLMADISGLMEEDMEELPDGLHEDIMASVRRSEMIKRNSRAGRPGKTNGRTKTKLSRPVRNLLATAACMAIVIAAAVSLNPGKRAESVVMARSAADSSQSTQAQATTENGAAESAQPPAATASPAPTPVPTATASPESQSVSIPRTGTTHENQGSIITTPAPTRDPYAGESKPIYSGNENTGSVNGAGQNHTIINPATPSPVAEAVPTPAPTPVVTPSPSPMPVQTQEPEAQLQQPDTSGEEQEKNTVSETETEGGQTQQPEPTVQPSISGEVHKTAPTRVFSMFPSLSELSPEESPLPQEGENGAESQRDGNTEHSDTAEAQENAAPLPQPSPAPCPDPEEYDMMNDKEGGRELLLQLMGMEDENGTAPEEAQLPEGQCDRSYVIAMVFDDIPCEVVVKVYGEDLYFSLAEIVIDPSETSAAPDAAEPPQATEQPAQEAAQNETVSENGTDSSQTQDSGEDFEPIWFKANCSLADFTAKLDSLTK